MAGTIADGVEVKRGTDPLDPSDDVVKIGVSMFLKVLPLLLINQKSLLNQKLD